jgi:hypothetical protein
MMKHRRLLEVLGTAILTVGVLFGVQEWYRSYVSIAYRDAEWGVETSQLDSLQRTQREHLSTGRMPIDRAIDLLARAPNRNDHALIRPEPSSDPGPAAGWKYFPGFVEPPAPLPVEEVPPPEIDGALAPEGEAPAGEAPPVEGAAPAQPAEPAGDDAAPNGAAPAPPAAPPAP